MCEGVHVPHSYDYLPTAVTLLALLLKPLHSQPSVQCREIDLWWPICFAGNNKLRGCMMTETNSGLSVKCPYIYGATPF
jgi:hypothetical protein